ncbi:MAG TPA: hypothetical protein VM782_01155 [Stellaceae bacterium]|nr:hypothetical protein [Stellaceae bacterium]
MKISKANERRHAMQRASERYGLTLDRKLHKEILDKIQRGHCRLIQRQSLRVAIYDITLPEATVRVVYDRKRHELVSFLPR